jgi:Transglutaminase-like superfamily
MQSGKSEMNQHSLGTAMSRTSSVARRIVSRYFQGYNGTGVNPLSHFTIFRPIAMSLIVSMLTMVVSPMVHGMQLKSQQDAQSAKNAAARYGELVRDLKEIHTNPNFARTRSLDAITDGAPRGAMGNATATLRSGLKSLGLTRGDYAGVIDQLEAEHAKLRQEGAELERKWRSAKVAPEIIAEQAKLDALVATKHSELIAKLKAANAPTSVNDPALQALKSFLQKEVAEPTHNKLNPKNLPWQSSFAEPGKLREPMADSATFKRDLADRETALSAALASRSQKKGVALSGSLVGSPSSGQSALPAQKKALAISTLPSAADLAATPDAPQTDAIRALAVDQLKKNPVAIYNWVHDNIAFVPTYGSVQGAEDTLNKKSGNAFDQASLLIAMLRSAGIQSRYVVGTIEVPEDKLRNWIGGFKTIDAAQQILGQGGIPNVGLVSGGRIKSIRMEHAWVEAYVSMFPGRGSKHVGGVTSGDNWVPLDASFKLCDFSDGMDLKDGVYFDTQGFLDAARQGATVNDAEGWVQNLNQANVKTKFDQYQQSIKQRVDQKPNATIADVLGTQTIRPEKTPYFSDVLKNRVSAIGERYSQLPNSLRAQFRYGIYFDQFSRNLDSPDFQYQVPTSEIAGKKITIAWVPASDASRQAIEALLPPPNADGSPIRPEQLPQGLPSSISLKAELRIEGQVVATSSAYKAGSEPVGAGAFTRYESIAQGGFDWDETTDQLVAGQQTALGVSIQGISARQIEILRQRMEATEDKLKRLQDNPSDPTSLAGLTGDQLAGDILTTNAWNWFATLQSHGKMTSRLAVTLTRSGENNAIVSSGFFDRPALSYGLVHVNAQPNKLFGVVNTGVSLKGALLDIGHVRHMRWVKDQGIPVDRSGQTIRVDPTDPVSPFVGDGAAFAKQRWVSYNQLRGQYSSTLEYAAPERLLNDTTRCNPVGSTTPIAPFVVTNPSCTEGISAMKAIAIAQSQGQKIFTITRANSAVAIPQLAHRSSVIEEVSNAVSAGKVVTIHQSAITANGWTGAGYNVIDPETGAGGYIIEGGARGGVLIAITLAILSFFAVALGALFVGVGVGALLFIGAGLIYGLYSYINKINKYLDTPGLTSEERDGTIKLLSALTVFTNLLALWKLGEPVAATLFIWMNSIFALAIDWIVSLKEWVFEQRNSGGG